MVLNVSINYVLFQANFFATSFHDALILYSLAINETLHEGGDIRDGLALRDKMWNRTFQGKPHVWMHYLGFGFLVGNLHYVAMC